MGTGTPITATLADIFGTVTSTTLIWVDGFAIIGAVLGVCCALGAGYKLWEKVNLHEHRHHAHVTSGQLVLGVIVGSCISVFSVFIGLASLLFASATTP